VRLAKYVQAVGAGLALVLCVYLGVQCGVAVANVSAAKRLLRKTKTEAANLARQFDRERDVEARQKPPPRGGVDFFAVKFDEWAQQERVRIESFVPEGAPTVNEIESDGVKLGTWNAFKVRAKGTGQYEAVIRLLNRFRHSDLPVRLDSFALYGNSDTGGLSISFDVVITVYEKKEQPNDGTRENRQ
jgi:hypothetical protein